MQHKIFRHILFAAALTAALTGGWGRAQQPEPAAHESAGVPCAVKVENPWVRATVPEQKGTGAFMRLTAQHDCKIVAAQSPIAGVAAIHRMTIENGVMRMRAVQGGLPLPAGQTVVLTPDGLHMMLMDLKQDVPAGKAVPITLTLQDPKTGASGTIDIVATARALGAGADMDHAAHMDMNH
ncbi:MAG: copper chaperone PCu(A)C [Burkholderiaceae bacterium]|jgi:copper(I)-binding protein|nr:copper chaperone PCu(A)C [Burkholderiaceae bacterium]